MENWLLNMGLSWTMSKLLPYILMILIGIILVIITLQRLKNLKPKLFRVIIGLLVLTLPFVGYFALNPIYEGDFSKGNVITIDNEMNPNKLTVIAMSGCPFCQQAIGLLNQMQERNPKMEIDFLVASENPNSLKSYQKVASQFPIKINIALAKDPKKLSQVALGSFPSFVIKTENDWKIWSNNQFGVMAMDQVEGNF